MAYREVEMVEIKEALRLWLEGKSGRQIGRQVGIDRKTVRSYIAAGGRAGLSLQLGVAALTDEVLAAVVADLRPPTGRPHGDAWALCERERAAIALHLTAGVRLSKARELLERSGSAIPYSTLHRFAVEVLGFGRTAPTVPVADGKPSEELEVDTGWVLSLPDEDGRMRRVRAWIFTANVSRHRFVWPSLTETTESAILACEAAWAFYGGVFRVLRPDNTKAIVVGADPLYARITPAFLEYAQARGFHVDAARARSPKDKARVERSVRAVRDDCFAGEKLLTLDDSRARARSWCESEYGMRRHTRTQRLPREHFDTVEKPALLRDLHRAPPCRLHHRHLQPRPRGVARHLRRSRPRPERHRPLHQQRLRPNPRRRILPRSTEATRGRPEKDRVIPRLALRAATGTRSALSLGTAADACPQGSPRRLRAAAAMILSRRTRQTRPQ